MNPQELLQRKVPYQNLFLLINMKNILLFITLIICSCSNNAPKEVIKENAMVIKDIIQIPPVKIEPPIVLPDTVFYVNGKTQLINGLKCYIQYTVIGDSGNREENQGVAVDSFYLVTPKQKILLEQYTFYGKDKVFKINRLAEGLFIYSDFLKDVNKDGFMDIKLQTDISQNSSFDVYIFDKKNMKFILSNLFGETDKSYDKKLNRVSNIYTERFNFHIDQYYNLNKDRKTIAFIENIKHDRDTFSYEKIVNKKVVKRRQKVVEEPEYFDSEKWLERGRSDNNAYE